MSDDPTASRATWSENLPVDLRTLIADAIREDRVRIPPFPSVAAELNALLQRKPSADEIARVVTKDQTLAAAVLRLANSAAMGAGRPVTTVPAALTRIGVNELVVLAFATAMRIESTEAGPLLEIRRVLWHRGLTASIVCRDLAMQTGGIPPDTALLCGLLFDFGKIVSVAAVENVIQAYPTVIRLSIEDWLSFIGEFHCDLGSVIAQRWNLPSPIAEVVSCQPASGLAGQAREAADLIDVATAVVDELFRPDSPESIALSMLNGERPFDASKVVKALPEKVANLMAAVESTSESRAESGSIVRPVPVIASVDEIPKERTSCRLAVTGVSHPVDALSTRSIRIRSTRPLAASFVTRAVLERGQRKLELFVTVMSCRPTGGEYTIDLQPFCLQGERARHFSAFVGDATRPPPGPPGGERRAASSPR
jgi:HD-like signal output (HDOD) protein